jgi:hypothetical protein
MSDILVSGLAGLFLYEALDAAQVPPSETFCLRPQGDGYSFATDVFDSSDCVATFRDRVVIAAPRELCDGLGACRLEAHLNGDSVSLLLRKLEPDGEGSPEVVWQSKLP